MTPTATAVSSPNPVETPAAVTVPPRTAPASVAPIAPPMYRPVRYVPAAIPTRSGSIASKAAACRGAPASPIPNPTSASIRPSSRVEASGATSHRTASPTTHASMPITAGRRRPTASDIRPPMGAAIAPSAEMPSSTNPLVWAFPAWSSSTRSGTSTRVPWRITVAPNTPTTAAVNDLDANRCGSTAGCSVRRSTRTKTARSTAAATTAGSADPPPSSSRSPSSSATRNAARRPRPGRSIGRGAPRTLTAGGRARAPTATAARMATGTATMKIDRQPRPATSSPPMSGPMAALVETSMSNNPNAEPRRSGGAISRSSATELVETSAPVDRLEHPRQREHLEGHGRGRERRGQRERRPRRTRNTRR